SPSGNTSSNQSRSIAGFAGGDRGASRRRNRVMADPGAGWVKAAAWLRLCLGLAELERAFQHYEQPLDLGAHQREACVEFGAQVVALGVLERVDRTVEQLELADHQVL